VSVFFLSVVVAMRTTVRSTWFGGASEAKKVFTFSCERAEKSASWRTPSTPRYQDKEPSIGRFFILVGL